MNTTLTRRRDRQRTDAKASGTVTLETDTTAGGTDRESRASPRPEARRAARESEPKPGLVARTLERLGIDRQRSASRGEHMKMHRAMKSFVDLIPWFEIDEGNRDQGMQVLFCDGVSRMAVYEIEPVATEGRSSNVIAESLARIQGMVRESCPEHSQNPWVMQMFLQDERDLSGFAERVRNAASKERRDSVYTKAYQAELETHLLDVARAEGVFHDSEVTDTPWGGRHTVARVAIYRRYWRGRALEDTADELEQVCSRLEAELGEARLGYTRMDGQSFFRWMRGWLNPGATICDGDISRLESTMSYPEKTEDLPLGRDLVESMMYSQPVADPAHGVWKFDGFVHQVVRMNSLAISPRAGAVSAEIIRGAKAYTLFERLPEGSVLSMTIVMRPQSEVSSHIESVRDWAMGTSASASHTRKMAEAVLRRLRDRGEKIFPTEVMVYLRAPTLRKLKQQTNRVASGMRASGINVVEPTRDPIELDHFPRGLPGVFNPAGDEKSARAARLLFAEQIAALAPLYGRWRGTKKRPVIQAWNRGGEPVGLDPIGDRVRNAHLLMVGTPGSGKSATLNAFLQSMLATSFPRLFIIELGNSFGLSAKWWRRQGLSVHAQRVTMTSDISVPPFVDALELVDEHGQFIVEHSHKGAADGEEVEDDNFEAALAAFADEDRHDDNESRDILGELELVAKLMISSGSETRGEIRSPTLKLAIRESIKDAARRVKLGETDCAIVRPQDVRESLIIVSRQEAFSAFEREIIEMSAAMEMYCDPGTLAGRLFNREGTAWPDVDVTMIDLADAGLDGNEDLLAILYISIIQHVGRVGIRDQASGRDTVCLTDEAHLVLKDVMLLQILLKATKMWRKIGVWLWLATQNFQDFSADAQRMLSILEWWFIMWMEEDELIKVAQFKGMSEEETDMLRRIRKARGRYVEALVKGASGSSILRMVPPALSIALAQTDPDEKRARSQLMKEHRIPELDAAMMIAEHIRCTRLGLSSREELHRLDAERERSHIHG